MATSSTNGSYPSSNSPLTFPFFTDQSSKNGGMGNYSVVSPTGAIKSLFGRNSFWPFPTGTNVNGHTTGTNTNIHNDDVYDISTVSIINYTANDALKAMRLTAAHFAYLKNEGVFPNNRLIVARRFAAPVGNDLTAVTTAEPLATLISWVPADNNFLDIIIGEKWMEADGTFETILNSFGRDMTLGDDNRKGMGSLGTIAAGAFGAIPLPGLMEGLQRQLFVKLGIAGSQSVLPSGNPNLIKEAKRRVTIDKGSAGSGLICQFSVKMKVEYEHKYINGVDPTLVYLDIIGNALSFATSDSQFMYNHAFAKGANNIITNLMSGDLNTVQQTLTKWITAFVGVLSDYISKIIAAITTIANPNPSANNNTTLATGIKELFVSTVGAVIGKYKVAIMGVISALTGVASTPWHVTIGNPKRPFFCSGDMYMDNVQMSFGPILAFNDLPSTIIIEFELKNARNLGAQEIYNRFNTGIGRSYLRLPDINSSNSSIAGLTQAADRETNIQQTNNNGNIPPNASTLGFNGLPQ